jgi:capsular exopolysaccharide synthesis family protein
MISDPSPSDLRQYLATLWHRKWYVVAVLAVVVGTAAFYSYRQTPEYSSTAEVLVRPVNLNPTEPSTAGGFVNMNTEQRVAGSAEVATLAAKGLGGTIPAGIRVDTVEGTETLDFTSTSGDPAAAQKTAQAFARAYLQFRREEVLRDLKAASDPIAARIKQIDQQLDLVQRQLLEGHKTQSEQSSLNIQFNSLLSQRGALEQKLNDLILPENINVGDVLQDAQFPGGPSSPNHQRTLSFALFVGLALGIGLAFLRDRLDQRIRGREDLERRIGVPVLAMIPRIRTWRRGTDSKVVTMSQPGSAMAEAHRTLRTSLMRAATRDGVKKLMLTSARAQEGKTFTTANLGVALAQAGRRVVLVAADLRRPRLQQYFFNPNGVGLAEVLSGDKGPVDALAWAGIDNLWVLHSGSPGGNPDLFSDPKTLHDVLAELESVADFVLIDSAPILGVSDAIALAPMADAVLLVADASRGGGTAIEEAARQLERIGANLIGAVLTNCDHSVYPYYGRYTQRGYVADSTGDRVEKNSHSPRTESHLRDS